MATTRDDTTGCIAPYRNGSPGKEPRLSRRTLRLLAQPLDRGLVSQRESADGQPLQYIEGWVAIRQANRIFGYDGWGCELVDKVQYRTLSDAQGGMGMYTATVRLLVRGCPPHVDVGCGLVADDTPEAHEVGYKGAVTDALKRTLRHLGDQYGNGLRAGGEPRPIPLDPVSAAGLETMRQKVRELSSRLGVSEEKLAARVLKRYGQPLDALGPEEVAEMLRLLSQRVNGRRRSAA